MVAVVRKDGELVAIDQLNLADRDNYADVDLLEDAFVDGEIVRDQSLSEIRALLHSQI